MPHHKEANCDSLLGIFWRQGGGQGSFKFVSLVTPHLSRSLHALSSQGRVAVRCPSPRPTGPVRSGIFSNYMSKDTMNLLFEPAVAKEVKDGLPGLGRVVSVTVQRDHINRAFSASLEHIKHQASTDLLTQFYEAELGFFGMYMFDKKGEPGTGDPSEGKHHYEWKPA